MRRLLTILATLMVLLPPVAMGMVDQRRLTVCGVALGMTAAEVQGACTKPIQRIVTPRPVASAPPWLAFRYPSENTGANDVSVDMDDVGDLRSRRARVVRGRFLELNGRQIGGPNST